jgi:hypothetical protein
MSSRQGHQPVDNDVWAVRLEHLRNANKVDGDSTPVEARLIIEPAAVPSAFGSDRTTSAAPATSPALAFAPFAATTVAQHPAQEYTYQECAIPHQSGLETPSSSEYCSPVSSDAVTPNGYYEQRPCRMTVDNFHAQPNQSLAPRLPTTMPATPAPQPQDASSTAVGPGIFDPLLAMVPQNLLPSEIERRRSLITKVLEQGVIAMQVAKDPAPESENEDVHVRTGKKRKTKKNSPKSKAKRSRWERDWEPVEHCGPRFEYKDKPQGLNERQMKQIADFNNQVGHFKKYDGRGRNNFSAKRGREKKELELEDVKNACARAEAERDYWKMVSIALGASPHAYQIIPRQLRDTMVNAYKDPETEQLDRQPVQPDGHDLPEMPGVPTGNILLDSAIVRAHTKARLPRTRKELHDDPGQLHRLAQGKEATKGEDSDSEDEDELEVRRLCEMLESGSYQPGALLALLQVGHHQQAAQMATPQKEQHRPNTQFDILQQEQYQPNTHFAAPHEEHHQPTAQFTTLYGGQYHQAALAVVGLQNEQHQPYVQVAGSQAGEYQPYAEMDSSLEGQYQLHAQMTGPQQAYHQSYFQIADIQGEQHHSYSQIADPQEGQHRQDAQALNSQEELAVRALVASIEEGDYEGDVDEEYK